jgi:hypothetical protein
MKQNAMQSQDAAFQLARRKSGRAAGVPSNLANVPSGPVAQPLYCAASIRVDAMIRLWQLW